ncbi:hypothetical protein [Pseudonocardia sp.]|jgi:hypothetical protein|uniref:hypothetical protein n=1 Tax=Pseudonocardia sp. TaxID=60912 RepID=UPI002614AE31|nr:hypothetical protein [Pseudonocardia sp.]MCW2719683.1 putative secreted protein [Pseudonocardia sp.]MDT7614509.1 hypothetical protein [Pseudonocardiales bacterium]
MTRGITVVIGIVLALLGALWTLQGAGVAGGSFMSGSRLWLVIGVVLLIVGIGVLVRGLRGPRSVG